MERIAIVTGEDAPDLTDDGRRLLAALERRGYDAASVRWSDSTVDWAHYDAAVLRSCWKYYLDPSRFRDWLSDLERAGVVVRNPPDVVRWNMHKSYLLELAEAGVAVVPSVLVEDTRERDLAAILERSGWERAIVKPTIGTSAAGAWTTTRETAPDDQRRFERRFRGARQHGRTASDGDDGPRLSRRGALVQAFLPEVANGERSLVFFGGEYSHAWRDLRTPDSFGVEANFDAEAEYAPASTTIGWARDVLRAAVGRLGIEPHSLPYARVDCVMRDDGPVLLELELIEPYLSFADGDGVADRLASTIVDSLDAEPPGQNNK
ncbi:ATP-grasp domain-containing protein [Halovivax limisalsi]|uniref:ATP-grasp domain-containing protein n=1 Tax=Halovivax limisalsi TaxID=1453760 RepID=UPI001FFDE5B5|nr:hypothetical protein [Halovivax limisalsi]